ncbi:beta-propeller domain-containing protein [Candidatus Woesearchaeota archaeon]|nr:beta-propeller domain-containing protein [Candidatus Woesearchaeota archaeon]
MKTNKLSVGFYLWMVLVIGILTASCVPKIWEKGAIKIEASQELKKFSSANELREYLQKNAQASYGTKYFGGISRVMAMGVAESAAPSAQKMASDSGASQYSTTNIQVEGVDEADFVKNDGRYIYTLTQNRLVIVDAYPADNAKIVSETEIGGMPRNMLVNKDRLVVLSDDNAQVPYFAEFDFVPRPRYTQKTHVFVYDIEDRSSPKLVNDYSINGYYFESRMIGDFVYFIAKDNVYFDGPIMPLPAIRESSRIIAKPDIYYFDNPEQNYVFHTIASFNIFSDEDEVNAKTFMMGYSNTLYVSQDNIYIAYQKNLPWRYYEVHNEERFYDVVVPLLPSDVRSEISKIKDDSSLNSQEKWDKISSVLEDMYNNMEDGGRQELIEKIEKAIDEYEIKLEAERRKTVIHKIGIDNGEIEYKAKGEVPGYLLNQFSMDEHDGNLRLATTTEIWARKSVMYNNVFVLDEGMKTIGKLEAIAPDERIYSARFIGGRLYMVTFKRIDPLFVIDLSSPEEPEILGELKIPGFSDYLHPYDENHIIGIGKETEGNEWGGVSVKGVKLALFDVSDVENPKQLDKYEIGDRGTDSEALKEHKAFLFDKGKNLLVIPVTEAKGKMEYDSRLGYYRQRLWQGAYVFGLTLEGFEVKGKITHNEGDEQQDYYYYGSPNAVRRSLYMDEVLYTISMGKIKANDLNDIANEIKEVKLPYEKQRYDYPYPVKAVGSPGVAVPETEAAERG